MAEDPVPAEPEPAEAESDAEPAPPGSSRRWPPATVFGVLLVVLGLGALAYAFLTSDDGTPSASTTVAPVTSPTCSGEVGTGVAANGEIPAPPTVDPSTRFAAGRKPLCGFGEAAVTVTQAGGAARQLCLLLAATEAQRERGLMEVRNRSLGGYDGMVFTFAEDQPSGGFYMRNTPMPLSIAYIDASGKVVDVVDMAPCADVTTCPTYPSSAPFRTALEVPQGRLAALGIVEGATVTVQPPATACAPKGG